MDEHKKAVAKLCHTYLGGKCSRYGERIWALAGPHNAKARTHIMRVATGNEKLPQSKCGITALSATLVTLYGITGASCRAAEDNMLGDAIDSYFNE